MIDHDRKRYILDALRSVLTQTLRREEYEVVAVTNYRDEKIEEFLETHNIPHLIVSDKGTGAKYAFGVKHTTAPIICFLDDDDMFSSEKLEKVLRHFKDGIAYLHTARINVDEQGKEIGRSQLFNYELRTRESREILRALRLYLEFNISSICVKRETLDPFVDVLSRVVRGVDYFYLFVALTSALPIRHTSEPLTIYRVHRSLMHFFEAGKEEFLDRARKYYSETAEAKALMASAFDKYPFLSMLIRCDEKVFRVMAKLCSKKREPRTLREALQSMGCLQHPLSFRVKLLGGAIVSLISPSLSSEVFFRYYLRRYGQ
ncbi:hypothetical protein GCM10007116_14570 [Sulfodiicoccus acidiphilus]|uniref:Glycosyltransferase 2-like domain-containing protein n=1 Tax=Sulfodiicoccus acidiphilus TaxID=1670455 RepID=A0A830GZV8_9CREN|nr:hypothetical protein GCM10007116_14570 [Sulfodiicoccus acidiphilus]